MDIKWTPILCLTRIRDVRKGHRVINLGKMRDDMVQILAAVAIAAVVGLLAVAMVVDGFDRLGKSERETA